MKHFSKLNILHKVITILDVLFRKLTKLVAGSHLEVKKRTFKFYGGKKCYF